MKNNSPVRGRTLVLALFVSASTLAAVKHPVVIDDPAYTHAQRLVEVEPGRRLNLYCLGHGEPTVVFDSGLTDETSEWGLVQPVIARKTRACSYDRAGVGFSDPENRPGTSANIVDDLHRLLVAAGIKPPYVVVSHSSGGMNLKLYADTYLSDVAGMVFVDPTHEDQTEGYRKVDPRHLSPADWDAQIVERILTRDRECVAAAPAGFEVWMQLYKQCIPSQNPHFSDAIYAAHLKIYLQPSFQQAQLGEEGNIFRASADQVRAGRRSFGDVPLIVLTRSAWTFPLGPDETRDLRDARYRLWIHLHDDIAQLSTRGVNRIVLESGHNIPFDQPQAVNGAILEVLAESRRRMRPNDSKLALDSPAR